MAYAIGHVVFGVDLQAPWSGTDPYNEFRDEIEELTETEVVENRYSGNGEEPVFFGIVKGEIDEAHTVRQEDIQKLFTVTNDDRVAYRNKLDEAASDLSSDLLVRLEKAEPTLFITWGSS